jgi:SSS family solute:Na+ symporter
VTVLGLSKVGGLDALMHDLPQRFHIYHWSHPECPIVAYYICSFFVGAYYISSNQFMVQRCLGARSDWDGRMGLLFSNYLKLLMPFIVVLPGIIAFRLSPGLEDRDQAYPRLVAHVAVPGLVGLMMAALASAVMSTLSSAANSASTLLTMDLIRPFKRDRSEAALVRTGKTSTAVLLLIGTLLGLFYSRLTDPATGQPIAVFSLIMNIFFFVGPPLSIVFLAGIFWPRATPAAAVTTIVGGYVASLLTHFFVFAPDARLPDGVKAVVMRFNNFLYVAIFNGVVCLIIMVVVTLFTKPRPHNEIRDLIWRPSVMRVRPSADAPARGTRNLAAWWALCMALTAGLYLYFAWFQLRTRGAPAARVLP